MKSPFAKLNAALRKQKIAAVLRKGRGYLYFTTTGELPFNTESIYWNDFDDSDIDYLVGEARRFVAEAQS